MTFTLITTIALSFVGTFDVGLAGCITTDQVRAAFKDVLVQEESEELTQIPGNPGDLSIDALPFSAEYEPNDPVNLNSEDFELIDEHYYATRVFEITFFATATVGEVNAILTNLNATILGSSPGRTDFPEIRGLLLLLRTETTSFAELLALTDTLEQHPLIKHATPLVR